uniref:Uncharacterized protein n=1 Tax=Opuntia streptacantha TaxID=393608 RepID=A0A7C9AN02_OPUST
MKLVVEAAVAGVEEAVILAVVEAVVVVVATIETIPAMKMLILDCLLTKGRKGKVENLTNDDLTGDLVALTVVVAMVVSTMKREEMGNGLVGHMSVRVGLVVEVRLNVKGLAVEIGVLHQTKLLQAF